MKTYQHFASISAFRCRYLDPSLYIVTSLFHEGGSNTDNVKIPFLQTTDKTKVDVKWKIMGIQPEWGCGFDILPSNTLMQSLKKIHYIHQQVLAKYVSNKGMLHQDYKLSWPKPNCPGTCAIDTAILKDVIF